MATAALTSPSAARRRRALDGARPIARPVAACTANAAPRAASAASFCASAGAIRSRRRCGGPTYLLLSQNG
eukprot:8244736-Lingulodinium_polyedra.AAC.1